MSQVEEFIRSQIILGGVSRAEAYSVVNDLGAALYGNSAMIVTVHGKVRMRKRPKENRIASLTFLGEFSAPDTGTTFTARVTYRVSGLKWRVTRETVA